MSPTANSHTGRLNRLSSPQQLGGCPTTAWLPGRAASRMRALRPAPAARLIAASHCSVPRAHRACAPGDAAAGCHRRLALRWALRAHAPAAAWLPPRGTRSAPKAWALRARAPTCCSPPDNCARCLLVVGTSKTSCASRCSRRSVQGALRAPAEGEGGEGWSRLALRKRAGQR